VRIAWLVALLFVASPALASGAKRQPPNRTKSEVIDPFAPGTAPVRKRASKTGKRSAEILDPWNPRRAPKSKRKAPRPKSEVIDPWR
jgi:hypothetical protein